jgi:hypothetical protein
MTKGAAVKVVVLGIPLPPGDNRWKDDMCEDGESLGWDVTHVAAKGIDPARVVKLCEGADIFIWAMTHGHMPKPPSSVDAMLRRIEAGGTRTVALHMDLYWGISARERKIGRHPWWTCQFVFTADGGHQAEFFMRKVNHFWMPPAIGSQYNYHAEPQFEDFHPAVFVGGYVPGIHGPDRAALVQYGRERWGDGFALYGRGEGALGQLYGHRLNALYARTGLVLGDSAPSPRYWSDRLPCTLGRGALMSHPEVEGMAEQGFTDEVMITYPRGDLVTLADKIDSLSSADMRHRAESAHELVRERHTWKHRMQELQDIVMADGNCFCQRAGKRLLGGCWCGR